MKSFSRAALSLAVPASTLSRRISELERYVGVRLLNRSTRKVQLTEAGAVYFERCQHVVAEARVAHEELSEFAQQPKGRLRVSMPSTFATMFMPRILDEFSDQYPGIQCELNLGIQAVDLLVDPFDIVIRFGKQRDSGVIARRIGSLTLGLYASENYLARCGTPTEPIDLVQHECLRATAEQADSVWELHAGPKMEKVHVTGRLVINNVGLLRQMAALGRGIVPLSPDQGVGSVSDRPLVRILPGWTFSPIPLLALFPSRLLPAKTRVFLEFLQRKLDQASEPAHDESGSIRHSPQR